MTLTPLITAAEGFPALERLAASAEEELLLSFRILDPKTRLRAEELTEMGLETWADLIAWLSRRGVRIRILIADFDPIFTSGLHRNAWVCASGFADVVQGDAQVICAPHSQRAGMAWRMIMLRKIYRTLAKLRGEDSSLLTPVQRHMLKHQPILRPVTLHQKFAIADRSRVVIGGLDVNERRYDTPDHDCAAEETWHDVTVALTDKDFAGALCAHFADCWNAALEDEAPSLANDSTHMDIGTRPQSRSDLKLLRTFSLPRCGAFCMAPAARITEHESAHLKLFAEAEDQIYIETQFLRHTPLTKALCQAAEREPDLQLMLILPAAPERVLFEGDRSLNARHAHGLQVKQIDRLRAAFGDRMALMTPAQPRPAREDEPELNRAAPVYLHSKVTIVDRKVAIVGSANLNGRSLRWDSEASVLARDPDFAGDLQDRLAAKWLRDRGDGVDLDRAASWNRIAKEEQARSPAQRKAYLLPYPTEKARRFSRVMGILPDDMF